MRVEPFIKSNYGHTGPSREDGGGPYGITYLVLRIWHLAFGLSWENSKGQLMLNNQRH